MGDILGRLLVSARTASRHVAVALPDAMVMTRVVQMDAALNPVDMEYQAGIEAGRHVPWPLDEMALDFEKVAVGEQEDAAQDRPMDVLVAASRREHVDAYETVLELASLIPKVVDVQSLALERAYPLVTEGLALQEPEAPVAMVDLELAAVRLCVLGAGRILYTREQTFEALTTDDDSALISQLVQHVGRSLQLCSSGLSSALSRDPECLVLTGSLAALPGLLDALGRETGIRCVLADPFAAMEVAGRVDKELLAREAPAMLVACGLALRSFD